MSLARVVFSALLAASLSAPLAAGTSEVRHPEDLFVVDCLLPAKVRSLGRMTKFAAPRRVARLSVHECELRGGEHSQDVSDNAWALQAWVAAADSGDAEAMNNVGEIWEQGVRGAPDPAQAAVWYRKAAEAGSRRAQANLGALYEQGLGVARDESQALAWYRRAAGMTTAVDLDAQKEIAALQAELARTRAEADATRAQLARVEGDLEGARAELATAERQAAAARAAAAQSAARPAPPVTAAETAVTATRARVADLEAAQGRYRRLLGELEAAERSGTQVAALRASDLVGRAGPTIQFVRPDVLATRGPSLAPLPPGAAEAEIVGRVEAPLGLASLLADGRAVETDVQGFFRVRVPAHAGTTVRFVALDRASRKAEAEIQFAAAASPPARSGGATPAPVAAGRTTGRRAFALVVADGAYRALPALATARADGEAMAAVLRERYGYETTLLADATFLDTMRALTDLGARLRAGDDLLVYFAGHGRLSADGQRGYWLPVDADPDDVSTWLPNDALARLLGTFAADRILVVSDSCYAGTLAAGGLDAGAPGGGARSRLVLDLRRPRAGARPGRRRHALDLRSRAAHRAPAQRAAARRRRGRPRRRRARSLEVRPARRRPDPAARADPLGRPRVRRAGAVVRAPQGGARGSVDGGAQDGGEAGAGVGDGVAGLEGEVETALGAGALGQPAGLGDLLPGALEVGRELRVRRPHRGHLAGGLRALDLGDLALERGDGLVDRVELGLEVGRRLAARAQASAAARPRASRRARPAARRRREPSAPPRTGRWRRVPGRGGTRAGSPAARGRLRRAPCAGARRRSPDRRRRARRAPPGSSAGAVSVPPPAGPVMPRQSSQPPVPTAAASASRATTGSSAPRRRAGAAAAAGATYSSRTGAGGTSSTATRISAVGASWSETARPRGAARVGAAAAPSASWRRAASASCWRAALVDAPRRAGARARRPAAGPALR